jgi:sugar/nucleoside kinase (ribokinase family)
MVEAMAGRGLDITACRVDPVLPTGASVILGNGTDRAILTSRGTAGTLRASDVSPALLRRARHLHVGSWFLQAAAAPEILVLVRSARAAGLTVSVDPNWDPSGSWDGGWAEVAALADVLLPNAAEACRLARVDDPEAAALALTRTPGGPAVVVKLGAGGALAATADGVVVRASALPVEPIDTTGAGIFDAGFVAAWLEDRRSTCLRFAVACGSLSTLSVGGTDAQPTRAQVEAVLAGAAP